MLMHFNGVLCHRHTHTRFSNENPIHSHLFFLFSFTHIKLKIIYFFFRHRHWLRCFACWCFHKLKLLKARNKKNCATINWKVRLKWIQRLLDKNKIIRKKKTRTKGCIMKRLCIQTRPTDPLRDWLHLQNDVLFSVII